LYETYGLQRLVCDYPEIRLRFFLETVYREGSPALTEGLWEMLRAMRSGHLTAEGLIDAVDALRDRLSPGEEDEYFLARLSYPYLRPEDAAGFARTQLGGRRQSEIVVTLEDADGRPFRVRHALNPKEVERLLQLFVAAKLDVRFRIEHRHLVALGERGQIIAGIYYEIDEELRSAHLEKIVVAERFRREGVADGLMGEFFNRLRAAGVNTVTTGFFRPEYFYRYGFRIEKRYAGLVKSLSEE
jgi:long-chain acyl-CoA synthetase